MGAAAYFDAPCAYLSPLSYECVIPLPPVTLGFCTIQGYDAMKARPPACSRPPPLPPAGEASQSASTPHCVPLLPLAEEPRRLQLADSTAAEGALASYREVVRRCLIRSEGYECQEMDGDFMLAWSSPLNAVLFCLKVLLELQVVHRHAAGRVLASSAGCQMVLRPGMMLPVLQVQEEMLANVGAWTQTVLSLPGCHAEQGVDGRLVFYGPRVQCGIYEGTPTCAAAYLPELLPGPAHAL